MICFSFIILETDKRSVSLNKFGKSPKLGKIILLFIANFWKMKQNTLDIETVYISKEHFLLYHGGDYSHMWTMQHTKTFIFGTLSKLNCLQKIFNVRFAFIAVILNWFCTIKVRYYLLKQDFSLLLEMQKELWDSFLLKRNIAIVPAKWSIKGYTSPQI